MAKDILINNISGVLEVMIRQRKSKDLKIKEEKVKARATMEKAAQPILSISHTNTDESYEKPRKKPLFAARAQDDSP